MKKIALICLLLIGASQLMAQDIARRDSLLGAMKNFKLPDNNFKLPSLKFSTKDSLLNRMKLFTVPGNDTSVKHYGLLKSKSGVTHSPIDNMPIANLPSNSRMPVYKLRKTDNMPGSNASQMPANGITQMVSPGVVQIPALGTSNK